MNMSLVAPSHLAYPAAHLPQPLAQGTLLHQPIRPDAVGAAAQGCMAGTCTTSAKEHHTIIDHDMSWSIQMQWLLRRTN